MLFLGLALAPGPAAAEPIQAGPQCGTRDSLHRTLLQRYREAPTFIAITSNGALMEVLATESGSTWTILVTTSDGLSCLVASGANWRPVPAALPGQRS